MTTLTGHTGWVLAVACTEVDGRPVVVTGGHDETVRVWDLADGTLLATLTGHTGWVSAVACTEVDGRPVAVTASDDNTVRLRNLATAANELLFQQNGVRVVAIGPNAEIVTSMGWDLAVNHKVERRDSCAQVSRLSL